MGQVTPVALTGANQAACAKPALLAGYSVRNSHATNAATVQIYDNASAASGTLLATWGLAAGASADVAYPCPVKASAGVFVAIGGTGTVEGCVRIA